MTFFFTFLQVFLGVVLVILILFQNSSSDSISSFSSSYSSSAFGSFKSTSDILSRYTWIVAFLFFGLTLAINFIYAEKSGIILEEKVLEKKQKSTSKSNIPFYE